MLHIKNNTFLFSKSIDKSNLSNITKKYLNARVDGEVYIDLKDTIYMDTAGAVFVLYMLKSLQKQNAKINLKLSDKEIFVDSNTKLENIFKPDGSKIEKILNLCAKNRPKLELKPPKQKPISNFFANIGEKTLLSFKTMVSFLSFLGGIGHALYITLLNPLKFRLKATLFHIQKNGLNAMPIIALTSLLIGVVMAFQGAVQLEKFGANIFIVEMVGIACTRELAPLIVAIVIAGRSASSYTAELGVMKITEEIDAMKTLGFSPWDFLILPRVVALFVALPLLVIFADFISVFGGMAVAKSTLGISFVEFTARFKETVGVEHILIGLIKAPFFGWIIATIGCFRGFEISSSTQSVGKYTTISVVNAIFWVIAFDALASVFLTKMDI